MNLSGARPRGPDVLAAATLEWSLYWRRRVRLATVLAAAPVLVAFLIALLKNLDLPGFDPILVRGVDALTLLFRWIYFLGLVFFVPLALGIGLVSREVEGKTLPLLLVRPLSRGSLLLGKFLGASAISGALLCGSYAVSSLVLLGADGFDGVGELLPNLPAYVFSLCLGSLAYCALFALLGLVARYAVVIGFAIFLVDSFIAFLPGLIRNLSVRYHLVSVAPDAALPGIFQALSVPSGVEAFFSLSIGTLLLLAVAMTLFANRNYV
ncbi:MAG: ABC transporter permease subunit [Candidatus Latescibacterota bacterium]|nr:MAG: ABC transporter permease subunit [Candidatus Latescibacterota bacterium]